MPLGSPEHSLLPFRTLPIVCIASMLQPMKHQCPVGKELQHPIEPPEDEWKAPSTEFLSLSGGRHTARALSASCFLPHDLLGSFWNSCEVGVIGSIFRKGNGLSVTQLSRVFTVLSALTVP